MRQAIKAKRPLKRKAKPEHQIIDGEPFYIRSKQLIHRACCDCGLVHTECYVVGKSGWIGVAIERNKRLTAARRRRKKK